MAQRGQMLQAIGEDGIVYTWYRRPYNRRVPTQRQLELQQRLQPIQGDLSPTPQMLNPKQTQLSELGELILIRCFQSLPINDRFNMEHCKFHTNTINGFNLMLEQFKRLIVFAVGRCANFQSELEKLPRSLRILNLNLFDVVNSANAIGNIRRQAPNITLLTIECRSLDVVNQVQDFEHLKVLSLHYSPILDDVITPDLFPANFSQELKALELFVVSENFIAMRFRPEFFQQLEHIKFDIIENPTTNYNTVLGQIVEFPALRSISLGHLKVNLLLTTEMAIGVFEHCPKIRSLYFYKSSNPNNIEEEEEYFRANEFIERFEQLKLNKIPPTSDSKKVVMLGNLFKGTKLEKGNEWIKCKENIRGSHVLRELFVNEFKEYEDNNTRK
uniref:Uncharacterized protein n=1 Tax=Meloidogyne javanica TaxID=6303 RepID=A0A915N2R6_MELJA